MSMESLVSGIITTYGRECDIVERAVLSMLKQTYSNMEIIVVDDNPNNSMLCDTLKQMCNKYPTVRYIKQDGNRGACAARNLGIVNAQGSFIGCLDDDDEWMPDKIEKQMSVFNKDRDGDIAVVYCNGIKRNVDTGEERLYNRNDRFKDEVTFTELLYSDYIGSTSHPLIRKSSMIDAGLFWEEQPARQDYEMWIRMSQNYRMVGINEPLFLHNIHQGEQISKNKKKSWTGYNNIYKRYLKHYRENNAAEKQILYFILMNRSGMSIPVILYGFRYYWVSLQIRLKNIRQRQ